MEASPNPSPTPRVQAINEPAPPSVDDERTRIRSIRDFGKKYKMTEIADKAIDDGLSIEEFRALALEEYDKRSQVMSDSNNGIGLSDKQVRAFSFLRLMASLSEPQSRSLREAAAFELDVCRAAADKSARNVRGVLIPRGHPQPCNVVTVPP